MLQVNIRSLSAGRRQLSGALRIAVPSGTVHVVVGPNGCGKSLLLDTINGLNAADGVEVSIQGTRLSAASSYSRWKSGLRRLFQTPTLPDVVPVRAVLERSPSTRAAAAWWKAGAWALVDAAGVHSDAPLGRCSFGQRRVIELCAATATGSACLLDEPFAGLDQQLVDGGRRLVRSAAENGTSVLVVDHLSSSHEWLYEQRHDWVFPNAGATPQDDRFESLLVAVASRSPTAKVDLRCEIKDLTIGSRTILRDAFIDIRHGTCLFVTGPNGSGKSTLLRAVGGFAQPTTKISVDLQGQADPLSAFLSPQPPKLVDSLSVRENLELMIARRGRVDASDLELATALLSALGFADSRNISQRAEVLSGGEASMVALVGACLSRCGLLLLDEPFESLSTDALRKSVRLLRAACASGAAVTCATHPTSSGLGSGLADARLPLDRGGITSGHFSARSLT